MNKQPVILCILDGWGHAKDIENNAIATANPKTFNWLFQNYPSTLLEASGEHAGLPDGQMGNSEVGHTTIGLGRVLFQSLVKINKTIQNNELQNNEILQSEIKKLQHTKKTIHLCGLVSDGGIHSHINHLIALLQIFITNGINYYLHIFSDGRDTSPKSVLKYIEILDEKFHNHLKIATISGRFFAMDRDSRWDRIQKAYNCIVYGSSKFNNDKECNGVHFIKDYIKTCYNQQIFDEFIPPVATPSYHGIKEGDSLLFFNYRADRVRQLLQVFVDEEFNEFDVHQSFITANCEKELQIKNCDTHCPKINILGLTEYFSKYNDKMKIIFPTDKAVNSLGEVISNANLKQLRIAETEKYAHVTFFFNGGIEQAFKHEDRLLINSPKVETYDLAPLMSCNEITTELLKKIHTNEYDFYVVNYANPDMLGHTGNLDTTVKAISAIDNCLEKLYKAIKEKNGTLIITADHGNAEQMFDDVNKQPHTSHTNNPVPFIIVNDNCNSKHNSYKINHMIKNPGLNCIAPTILDLLNINKPQEMNGESLILH